MFLYNTGPDHHLSDTTWNRKQFYSVTRVDRQGSQLLATDLPARRATSARTRSPSYAPLTAEAVHPLGADS